MGYKVVSNKKPVLLAPGTKLYSMTTGSINYDHSSSKRAARFLRRQRGLVTNAGDQRGHIWFFDTLENAELAIQTTKQKKILCSDKIGEYIVSEKGSIDFKREVPKMEQALRT